MVVGSAPAAAAAAAAAGDKAGEGKGLDWDAPKAQEVWSEQEQHKKVGGGPVGVAARRAGLFQQCFRNARSWRSGRLWRAGYGALLAILAPTRSRWPRGGRTTAGRASGTGRCRCVTTRPTSPACSTAREPRWGWGCVGPASREGVEERREGRSGCGLGSVASASGEWRGEGRRGCAPSSLAGLATRPCRNTVRLAMRPRAQVRLTFKAELQQVWIGSVASTQKVHYGSIHKIEAQVGGEQTGGGGGLRARGRAKGGAGRQWAAGGHRLGARLGRGMGAAARRKRVGCERERGAASWPPQPPACRPLPRALPCAAHQGAGGVQHRAAAAGLLG